MLRRRSRFLLGALVAAALTVGAGVADTLVVAAPAQASTTTATKLLAKLVVHAPVRGAKYQRTTDFGQAWSYDENHNGCDTRNDILKRDFTRVTTVAGKPCLVASGVLKSPYTGKTLHFKRGPVTSAYVQIDHVVALGDAWTTGAQRLSRNQRVALANDPLELLAVDGPSNNAKGDKSADEWLPAAHGYRCSYVSRQIEVKYKYHLTVTSAEKSAMTRVLSGCPGHHVTVPKRVTPAGGAAPVAKPVPKASSKPAPPKPSVSNDQGVVHPGAFCAPAGATGRTSAGTAMVCGTTANSPDRARWHSAG